MERWRSKLKKKVTPVVSVLINANERMGDYVIENDHYIFFRWLRQYGSFKDMLDYYNIPHSDINRFDQPTHTHGLSLGGIYTLKFDGGVNYPNSKILIEKVEFV